MTVQDSGPILLFYPVKSFPCQIVEGGINSQTNRLTPDGLPEVDCYCKDRKQLKL